MRIAQIAPLTESVPPRTYGGTERVVSYLTEELVAMGHDVTLFASGDSVTDAKLASAWPCALRFDTTLRDQMAPLCLLLELIARRAHEFDVLHCHLDYWPFSLLARQPTPFLTTLHGRLDLPELTHVYDDFPHAPLVSISDAQRRPLPRANFIGTVHHGLPPDLLTPRSMPRDYLAFLGRICPEKSPDRAIRIARQAGLKLKIAAKVDRADREYFETTIRPMIDGDQIEMIGEIGDAEKPAFLSGAKAMLLPIDWPEPFGLVMIEAMACGTPTIAFPAGSVPEVIDHGVTGYIVHDETAAVAALSRLDSLSPVAIRARFEERFTARRMAEDYISLYRRVALRSRPALRVVT
ncbi:MAG: glycosyl transferase [Rhodospirillales bacterium 20-64-7]|nr:MAG: glycosyl transferase [Rhodospirillales bacterium 20-64-7]HQT77442.1 glycosyltransferase family 4 protein [Rhodopila sp.]